MKGRRYLVRGAKNSALYDLEERKVYRVGRKVEEALRLASDGLGVEKIASRLGEGLVDVLSERGLVKLSEEPFPVQARQENLEFIWLELTSCCNLRCVHCYAGAGGKSSEELPTDYWKGALSEAFTLGCRQVQFTGGEATLREDLRELVDFAKAQGYEFLEIFTNATLLDEEKAKWMADLGVNVAVSLYSYRPDVHDRITGRKGSFSMTVRGIELLLGYKIPLRMAIIIMKENEEDVEGTIEFLEELGVDPHQIGTDVVRPTGRGRNEDLAPERYLRTTCPDFFLGDTTRNRCWPGKIAMTPHGDVIPCIFARDLVVGRYEPGNLGSIVRGEKLQKLWGITLEEVEVCRDCEYRYACWDCRAIAYTTTGNLYAKDPRCPYDPYDGRWPEGGEMEVPERPWAREDIVFREVEDEAVILDPESGSMHSLTKTAALIWKMCDGRHSLEDIVRKVLEMFEAEPSEVRRDVEGTIRRFAELGLLKDG